MMRRHYVFGQITCQECGVPFSGFTRDDETPLCPRHVQSRAVQNARSATLVRFTPYFDKNIGEFITGSRQRARRLDEMGADYITTAHPDDLWHGKSFEQKMDDTLGGADDDAFGQVWHDVVESKRDEDA